MSGMMIEGSKTGEEKTVTLIERRNSISTPGMEAQNAARRDNIHTKDQQRIRKLELDLKRLQDLLKQRETEMSSLQALADSQRSALVNMEVEKERAGSQVSVELIKKCEEIETLQRTVAKLRGDIEIQAATFTRQRKELEASLLEKIEREKKHLEEERDKNRASFRAKDEEMRGDVQKWRLEVDSLNAQIRDLKLECDKNVTRLKVDNKSQKDVEDSLRAEVRQLRGEIVQQQASVEEARRQSRAFNDYMVSICQPQFTVVKDEHSSPMETIPTNPQSMEGFVLVPLKLLLEGYSLLPMDVKRKIADDYADDIRTGRIPPSTAGTFAIGKMEYNPGNHKETTVNPAVNLRRSSLRRSSESK
jgi:hypothetical protein